MKSPADNEDGFNYAYLTSLNDGLIFVGDNPYDIAVKEGNDVAMEVLKEAGEERTRSK